MIRNLDFNDTFLPGGHPERLRGRAVRRRAGDRCIRGEADCATVVAYEIFIRLR
jgi:hypothetical protein